MATTTASNTDNAANALKALVAPLAAIGNFLIGVGESNARVRKLEHLHSLSDEQLAEKGLTREEIVRHVFAGQLYV